MLWPRNSKEEAFRLLWMRWIKTLLLAYRVCGTIPVREMKLMASLGKMDLFGLTLNIYALLEISLRKEVIGMMKLRRAIETCCVVGMICLIMVTWFHPEGSF